MVVLTSHSRLKIVCILKLNLSICLYFQPIVRCKDDYTHTANLFVIASFSFLFAPTTKSVYGPNHNNNNELDQNQHQHSVCSPVYTDEFIAING